MKINNKPQTTNTQSHIQKNSKTIIPFKTGKAPSLFENQIENSRLNLVSKKKIVNSCSLVDSHNLQTNEILLIIEHCSDCINHLNHTHHINDIYYNYSKNLQKAIIIRFPYIKVLLKPIDIKGGDLRIGGFEITLLREKDKANILLYSKIKTKSFPLLNTILDKLILYVPLFSLTMNFYKESDFEEVDSEDEIEENDEKTANLEINIYQLRIPMNQLIDEYLKDEVRKIFNSKTKLVSYFKKKENEAFMNSTKSFIISNYDFDFNCNNKYLDVIHEEKKIKTNRYKKENFNSFYTDSSLYELNYKKTKKRASSSSQRHSNISKNPSSKRTFSARPNHNMNNNISISSNTYINSSNISIFNENNNKDTSVLNHISFDKGLLSNRQIKDGEYIKDDERIKQLKGRQISRQYTKSKKIVFSNLPCDSYLVEIPESCSNSKIAFIVKFPNSLNKAYGNKINNENEEINHIPSSILMEENIKIEKFISLPKQNKCFVEIIVYTMNSQNNEIDLETITKSEVLIGRLNERLIDKDENKIILIENTKRKGVFEIVLEEGEYIVEVRKKEYDDYSKRIKLLKGGNKIYVEMIKK